MKLATFSTPDSRPRPGIVVDDNLLDLAHAEPSEPAFQSMLALLDASDGLARARAALDSAPPPAWQPLAAVRLHAPVPNPRKLLCLAGNYSAHIEESGYPLAAQDSQTPRVFMKPPSNTVIGPGDPIRLPKIAQAIDWEGELALVIGRRAKSVSAAEALACVAGYTVMNDVSERRLKVWERTDSRPKDEWFDWLNGKWLDTFAPQGPWLVTADELGDPQDRTIVTRVNGEEKQRASTAQMIFPVARVIEYISAMLTLEPGDLISTGTVQGVGATTGTFMQAGDRVEIEIDGIGTLCNPVEAD